MFKAVILNLLLSLAGCATSMPLAQIHTGAEEFCANHGGVDAVMLSPDKYVVVCVDNTTGRSDAQ